MESHQQGKLACSACWVQTLSLHSHLVLLDLVELTSVSQHASSQFWSKKKKKNENQCNRQHRQNQWCEKTTGPSDSFSRSKKSQIFPYTHCTLKKKEKRCYVGINEELSSSYNNESIHFQHRQLISVLCRVGTVQVIKSASSTNKKCLPGGKQKVLQQNGHRWF